ncbi:MAG TPA: LysM domain-containing protein [Acidimicrobiales bacterium]
MVAIQTLPPLTERSYPAPAPRAVRSGRRPSRPLPDRDTRIRRRRLAVLATAAVLAFGLPGALGYAARVTSPAPQAQPVPLQPAPGETYVVQPGDTLWTIARRIAPDSDPRPVVDALRSANGGAELGVGQELVLVSD